MHLQEIYSKFLFLKRINLGKELEVNKKTAELIFLENQFKVLVMTNFKNFKPIHLKMKTILNNIELRVLQMETYLDINEA